MASQSLIRSPQALACNGGFFFHSENYYGLVNGSVATKMEGALGDVLWRLCFAVKVFRHKSQVNRARPVVLRLLEAATSSSDATIGRNISADDDSPIYSSAESIPSVTSL